MRFKKVTIILFLIFAVALFLRVWKLGEVPHGFHSDEVVAGYEGTFILKNGVDTYGHFLPIYFDKFGDFRPTGVFYLLGISNLILGPGVFATRFAVALVGALTTIAVYFLFLEIFGKEGKNVGALLAAFLLAVLPWHIVLSRSTQESVAGIFLICVGLIFLLRFLKDKQRRSLIISLILLFLSYFFYTAHRLLVPLVILAVAYEAFVNPRFKFNRVLVFVAGASILLSILILSTSWGRGRGSQVLIFNYQAPLTTSQNLSFGDGPNNVAVARIFHNKAVVFGRELLKQYFSYFSLDFLFVKGGLPDRYVVPEQGLLFFGLIPILLAGFVAIIKKKSWLPIYFLALTPLVAFFTIDDVPNMNRVSFMVVPIVLIAGAGFARLFDWKVPSFVKKSVIGVISLVLVLEIVYFGHQYLVHHSQYRPYFRNDSYLEVAGYIFQNRQKYDKVLVSNVDHLVIYYWFVAGAFEKDLRYEMNKTPDFVRYDNIVFVKDDCPSRRFKELDGTSKTLVVDAMTCPSSANFYQVQDWVRGDLTQSFRALVVK